jgi:hypothetical protein
MHVGIPTAAALHVMTLVGATLSAEGVGVGLGEALGFVVGVGVGEGEAVGEPLGTGVGEGIANMTTLPAPLFAT